MVRAELARHDRRAVHEEPVELRPGQRLLAERRQRLLPARPCPQFLLLTVSAAAEHLACGGRYSASPMGSPWRRDFRRSTAFVCSCETRDSVTPSTSPISLSVRFS